MIESVGDLCLLSIVEIKQIHFVGKYNSKSAPVCSIKKVWVYEIRLWKAENQQEVFE